MIRHVILFAVLLRCSTLVYGYPFNDIPTDVVSSGLPCTMVKQQPGLGFPQTGLPDGKLIEGAINQFNTFEDCSQECCNRAGNAVEPCRAAWFYEDHDFEGNPRTVCQMWYCQNCTDFAFYDFAQFKSQVGIMNPDQLSQPSAISPELPQAPMFSDSSSVPQQSAMPEFAPVSSSSMPVEPTQDQYRPDSQMMNSQYDSGELAPSANQQPMNNQYGSDPAYQQPMYNQYGTENQQQPTYQEPISNQYGTENQPQPTYQQPASNNDLPQPANQQQGQWVYNPATGEYVFQAAAPPSSQYQAPGEYNMPVQSADAQQLYPEYQPVPENVNSSMPDAAGSDLQNLGQDGYNNSLVGQDVYNSLYSNQTSNMTGTTPMTDEDSSEEDNGGNWWNLWNPWGGSDDDDSSSEEEEGDEDWEKEEEKWEEEEEKWEEEMEEEEEKEEEEWEKLMADSSTTTKLPGEIVASTTFFDTKAETGPTESAMPGDQGAAEDNESWGMYPEVGGAIEPVNNEPQILEENNEFIYPPKTTGQTADNWERDHVNVPMIAIGVCAALVLVLLLFVFLGKRLAGNHDRAQYKPLRESFSGSSTYHEDI